MIFLSSELNPKFDLTCPCHSGKPYESCCQPYHKGKIPKNALSLMRSRYSAYALQLTDYIIKTTSPSNPGYSTDKKKWKEEILVFSKNTHFQGLKIIAFIEEELEAYVTFTATLKQEKQDVSFTEKSYFVKVDDQWLYESGESPD